MSVEVLAAAKVNLRLEILGRSADGFHELETPMLALALEVDAGPPELGFLYGQALCEAAANTAAVAGQQYGITIMGALERLAVVQDGTRL